MTNRLKTLDYNGTGIIFTADGWLNATASASALNKQGLENFLRSTGYLEYAEVVAAANSVEFTELKRSKEGNGGGTFLHPELAVVFARWISPAFAYWCDKQVSALIQANRETPYRIHEARTKKLQLLGRTETEIAARHEGVAHRLAFTNRLKTSGVRGSGYGDCTRAIYQPLFGGSTGTIRSKYGAPDKANVRDYLGQTQLAAVGLAEALAAERIEKEGTYGNLACEHTCNLVGQTVAKLITESRKTLSA